MLLVFSMDINLEMPCIHDDKIDNAINIADISTSTDAFHREDDGPSLSKEVNTERDGIGVEVNASDEKSANLSYYEPHEGLEFETKEAAYSFYREYARSVGFGITIKASRRSKKSGKFIDVKIACSRFGSKRKSSMSVTPRSCPKTDCKASMHMKRRQDGKWYIYSVVKEHNHEICPNDFYSAISGRYKKSGSINCQKKGLQLALDPEDVKLLLDTFILLQSETSDFFYAVDFDSEKRMRNVFWIDGKGRNDYGNFFDVVFFDTSCLKDNYKVPFLPVVGVNQHFQYILLGCALIGDESSSTLSWLMRTWLRAMGGQSPTVVITADDISVKEAVADVFPDSCHCFSLWLVLRKISQNLSHKVQQFPNLMSKFDKCIHQSRTDEEFQKRWHKMVDKFELGDDEWIRSLYDDRKKWVPTYMRGVFLGGLTTFQQSEIVSSFFDKYIHRDTTFKEFIDQYKLFLNHRCKAEDRDEFETRHQKPMLKSLSPFEKQMCTVYTPAIFKKFQAEVLGSFGCNLKKEAEDEMCILFRVNDLDGHDSFTVTLNKERPDVSCLCCSFEYRGFLCRHAMRVLQISGVSKIPSPYILKRWTIDAKISDIESTLSSRLNNRIQRLNDLCKLGVKLGEEGSLSGETYDIALFAIEEALKHCVDRNNSAGSVLEKNMLARQNFLSGEDGNKGNSRTKVSKKKRTPKKCKVCTSDAFMFLKLD